MLAGTPTLRVGAGCERVLAVGEVVAFRVGPTGTHQILNRAPDPARVLICATNELPEVAEQVEDERLAIITAEGLRLAPRGAPITAEGPSMSAGLCRHAGLRRSASAFARLAASRPATLACS